jgi:hypothetical protein
MLTTTCSNPRNTKRKTGKWSAAILEIVSRAPVPSQTAVQTEGVSGGGDVDCVEGVVPTQWPLVTHGAVSSHAIREQRIGGRERSGGWQP